MPVTDYEGVVLDLKAGLRVKRSWGADEVLLLISDLEVEHRLPEGQEAFDDRPMPRRRGGNGRPVAAEAAVPSAHAEPAASASGSAR